MVSKTDNNPGLKDLTIPKKVYKITYLRNNIFAL